MCVDENSIAVIEMKMNHTNIWLWTFSQLLFDAFFCFSLHRTHREHFFLFHWQIFCPENIGCMKMGKNCQHTTPMRWNEKSEKEATEFFFIYETKFFIFLFSLSHVTFLTYDAFHFSSQRLIFSFTFSSRTSCNWFKLKGWIKNKFLESALDSSIEPNLTWINNNKFKRRREKINHTLWIWMKNIQRVSLNHYINMHSNLILAYANTVIVCIQNEKRINL